MNLGLIIGCARSGTSILGEIVAAHEQVKYIYEAHEVWEIGGLGKNESHRLTADHATPEVTKKIRNWFDDQQDGRVIVEKCPRNSLRVPYLLSIFPQAKFIHIIRDGRDVTCSLRPGIGGDEWRHQKPEDWKQLQRLPWAERCAKVWEEVVTLAEKELQGINHLLVKYEDLVASPRTVAERVVQFLGLPMSASVLQFCEKVQDSTQGGYMADNYSRRWNTSDHLRRIGRWRENLTPEEQATVQEILDDTLRRFGYAS